MVKRPAHRHAQRRHGRTPIRRGQRGLTILPPALGRIAAIATRTNRR
jgi:hypothetical protein